MKGSLKYNKPIGKEKLRKYMDFSLKDKIKLSEDIIKDFYEHSKQQEDGKIYISSSFGKDSIVLIHLIRNLYPETPIIYINTGVDQQSNVELSKEYENVITLYPKKSMEQVIEEYGYILPIGKDKSSTIQQVRKNLYDGKFDTWRVRKLRGDLGKKSMFNQEKHIKDLLAPFKIDDKCCYWLKLQPLREFTQKENYKYQFNGQTAEESLARRVSITNNGFNMEYQSRPLGHWRITDILNYIVDYNLKLSSCYGDIVLENGKYKTTKFYRTGCTCCPIGSQKSNPNQFELLYFYDINTWDYVINKLGFKQVLDWYKIPYCDERNVCIDGKIIPKEEKNQQKLV